MLPELVCPRCKHPLAVTERVYTCRPCRVEYPVVAGIPDLRLFPDPWISLEDDRDKARRLEEVTRELDFEAAVRAYWDMTPDTPRVLAARYIDHVLRARARSAEWLDGIAEDVTDGPGPWLDLGSGTGDSLAAAASGGAAVVGTDIALRWLVVARRRPELRRLNVPLVCCCAEALPFGDNVFSRVTALGLLEHCKDPIEVAREAHRVLRPRGMFALRTVNRYSLLPEPHVRVWGVGFVPRSLADSYVRWRSGMHYRHHRPLSVRELRGSLRSAGFRRVSVLGARVLQSERQQLGPLGRGAADLYAALRRVPVAGRPLSWVAPLLEASAEASDAVAPSLASPVSAEPRQ